MYMSKIRGFKFGKRLIWVSRWIFRKIQIRNESRYRRLGGYSQSLARRPIAKLLTWSRRVTAGAKSFLKRRARSSYIQLGDSSVPKGHLAVYVGQKDGELHRVLVPVIYFNHPLFEELLKETEKEYGFEHPGGITIPCRFTEFERVKTRIASGSARSSRPRFARR